MPRRPRPLSSTRRTSASIVATSVSRTVGSRLPCSGIRARMCWSTSVSSTRKSTPSTSQPTSAICGAKWLAPTPKWIPGTPTSAMAAKTSAVCGATCCAYRRAGSAPTQESNSWIALAPASTCVRRKAAASSPRRSRRAPNRAGSRSIMAFVLGRSREGPPSIRYEATVNGAPAKPISGVDPNSVTVRATPAAIASNMPSAGPGSRSRSALASNGCATTGPTPGLISTSTPAALSGTTMSLKKIAASTPCRRTGCRVISEAISGSRQASSIAVPARSCRYSGRDRPACRMNHTGGRSTDRACIARTRRLLAVSAAVQG